ncbi:MAG: VTT domain-containing protein [Nitrososphaerota archaeon]|nr:VTT domain-containing protein [Nitrososphaerota archaeon]
MDAISQALLELAQTYGYLGVFMVSLAGSVIPLLPLPYLLVVVVLSRTLDPLVLGVVAGVGGSLGKITSYAMGRAGYRFFNAGTRQNVDALKKLVDRYGALGVFVFAVTPLPDDVYLLPMGMIRFAFWKFLLANTLGKVVLSVGVAYMARYYFALLPAFVGGSGPYALLVGLALVLAVTVVMLRADWELALETASTRGWRSLPSELPRILRLKKRTLR